MSRNAVEIALIALARGDFAVVVDDVGRENEGDLIIAAEKLTPERMSSSRLAGVRAELTEQLEALRFDFTLRAEAQATEQRCRRAPARQPMEQQEPELRAEEDQKAPCGVGRKSASRRSARDR